MNVKNSGSSSFHCPQRPLGLPSSQRQHIPLTVLRLRKQTTNYRGESKAWVHSESAPCARRVLGSTKGQAEFATAW